MANPGPLRDLLERGEERTRYIRRILAAWREGFARGREAGWQEGYEAAKDAEAAEWATTRDVLVGAVHSVLDPEGDARQRIRSAEAACRRDAAEHERAFVARAYNTPADKRNDVERATVQSYPPPRGSVPGHRSAAPRRERVAHG